MKEIAKGSFWFLLPPLRRLMLLLHLLLKVI